MDHIFLTIKIIYRCTFTYINTCCYIHVFQWFSLKYEFLGDSNKTMMREDQEIIYWEQSKGKSNIIKGEKKKETLFFGHKLKCLSNIHWERNVMNYITFNFQWKEKKIAAYQKILTFFFLTLILQENLFLDSLLSLKIAEQNNENCPKELLYNT